MRIVAGSLGGRKIDAPRGTATRPTSDRVREAIFNILGAPAEDARVLDLYAGTGALGLEALSRGASHAVFVESEAPAHQVLNANVAALGAADRATVLRTRAEKALDQLAASGAVFVWIFVDPPYKSGQAEQTLASLGDTHASLLGPNGCVVVEHDRRVILASAYSRLNRRDERRYGDTAVSFYRPVT